EIEVPRDLGLLSWDDSLLAEVTSPGITALSRRPFDMGRSAGDLLVRLIEGALAAGGDPVVAPASPGPRAATAARRPRARPTPAGPGRPFFVPAPCPDVVDTPVVGGPYSPNRFSSNRLSSGLPVPAGAAVLNCPPLRPLTDDGATKESSDATTHTSVRCPSRRRDRRGPRRLRLRVERRRHQRLARIAHVLGLEPGHQPRERQGGAHARPGEVHRGVRHR